MEKQWRAQGLENIPEEELRKISDLFIAKQKAELDKQNKKLGVAKGSGIHSKSTPPFTSDKKQRRKRGRRTNGEVLHDLGILMINSGKMKALQAFSSHQ